MLANVEVELQLLFGLRKPVHFGSRALHCVVDRGNLLVETRQLVFDSSQLAFARDEGRLAAQRAHSERAVRLEEFPLERDKATFGCGRRRQLPCHFKRAA